MMKFLTKFISRKINELRGVGQYIRRCPDVSLSEDKRRKLKQQIMASIRANHRTADESIFSTLIEKIKILAAEISPSIAFQSVLKDKMLTLIEFNNRRFPGGFPIQPGWLNRHKRLLAGGLAFAFVFMIVFNTTFVIKKVDASYQTTLEEVSGEVLVIREDKVMLGESAMSLRVDDVVKTGSASKAIIRFLDQSVSRLDENTEVKISKLFVNPSNKTETFVEVVLNRGRLWARVVSLIDNISRFQVKAKNTVAVAKKKAAFGVEVSSAGEAVVSAIHNKVDLVVATGKDVIETTLAKGFVAEMKTGTNASSVPQIRKENADDAEDNWVADNLAQDKVYMETVKQENRTRLAGQVKALPGSPMYAVKELSEGAKIALTLDNFERQKKVLITMQEKMAEIQVLMTKRDFEGAKASLRQVESQLAGLLKWIKEKQESNPDQAVELKAQIFEVLNTCEKQLALILPIDPLYILKLEISRLKIAVSNDPVKRTQELASQAGNKLLEAHDLAEQGDADAAKKQIEAYSQALSDVVSEVRTLPTDTKEEAVGVLLDNKTEDLKSLEAMTASPEAFLTGSTTTAGSSEVVMKNFSEPSMLVGGTSTSAADLQKTATDAKTDTLTKVGEMILDVQKTPNTGVMQKLENMQTLDVNGKSVVNMTLLPDKVLIKTDGQTISVTGSSTPTALTPAKQLQTGGLKVQE